MLGVAASGASGTAVITAGIAGLMAGALSMAAGEYVSVSSQRDAERADIRLEERELRLDPQGELRELAKIYERRGLHPAVASDVALALSLTVAAPPASARVSATVNAGIGALVGAVAHGAGRWPQSRAAHRAAPRPAGWPGGSIGAIRDRAAHDSRGDLLAVVIASISSAPPARKGLVGTSPTRANGGASTSHLGVPSGEPTDCHTGAAGCPHNPQPPDALRSRRSSRACRGRASTRDSLELDLGNGEAMRACPPSQGCRDGGGR